MSKSKFVDFRAVKSAVTMEQVLQHYGLLENMKRSGDSLSGCCPIHKGSNPTQFRVSVSKNVWNCFSECKHGGNTLDFIARMEQISIHAAAHKAIEWFGLDPEAMSADSEQEPDQPSEAPKASNAPRPKPAKTPAPAPENGAPNKPLGFRLDKLEKAHPYLAERGLTPETIIDFGIGFCAKGMMAERIAIPIHNPEGQVVAYAGRFPGEPAEDTPKYKLPQGFRKSLEVFNIDRASKEPADNPLVIVEGFFACMKLWQAGLRRTVALMGSSLSEAQANLIRRHTDSDSRLVLLFDEDDAGRAGREQAALSLARFAYVRIVALPQEGQQVDSLRPEELHSLLDSQFTADTAKSRTESSRPEPPPVAVKTYEGQRSADGQLIVTVFGQERDPRFDLRQHSLDGFECGYGGSDPAQLALAILADHFGDAEQALSRYQDFKWKVVAGLPKGGWSLTRDQIVEALASLEQPQPKAP